ncbi:MAG: hypothetical protein COA47_14915 [Robiginitomaculum sp.]|nr:MAG: hypothetical protein COA47_14915 [Robiginitomaculum sp.]
MTTSKDTKNDRGIALISVLWALMILSILALSVMTVVRVQSHYASNIGQKLKAEAVADAGIYLAIQKLSAPGAVRKLPGKISSLNLTFAGKDIKVTIIPEDGKIDLNMSHEVLIAAALAYNGMDENEATTIAEDIRNIRRNSSEKAFKIISDIRQFKGISGQLYSCIAPYLTVYSNRVGVNYSAASDDMKAMIKWADKVRWGGQNWLEISGGQVSSLVSGTRSVLQQTGSHAGKAFTIRAEIALNDEVKVQRTAIIRITGNRREPFWVYKWESKYQNADIKCKRIDEKRLGFVGY